jgi:hypothetical protein
MISLFQPGWFPAPPGSSRPCGNPESVFDEGGVVYEPNWIRPALRLQPENVIFFLVAECRRLNGEPRHTHGNT